MVDRVPVAAQLAHEVGQQRERVVEGLQVRDLAADMHVDACDRDAGSVAARA